MLTETTKRQQVNSLDPLPLIRSCLTWLWRRLHHPVFVFVAVFAAPAAAQTGFPNQLDLTWQAYRPGIQIAHLQLSDPRPVRAVVAKVDLRKKLRFVVTPGNGDRRRETQGLKTSSFLKKFSCDLAINAGPFQPVLAMENGNHDVHGLQISAGELVSPADNQRPVLMVSKAGNVAIVRTPPQELTDVQHAVPGFHIVLWDGQVEGEPSGPLHPRTAVAISQDNRWLLLVAVDGRQPDRSEGLTTFEVGQLLKLLGGYTGINLDGGGTTTLVTRDDQGKPVVLNRPIQAGIAGWERPSGSHFGVILADPADR